MVTIWLLMTEPPLVNEMLSIREIKTKSTLVAGIASKQMSVSMTDNAFQLPQEMGTF